MKNPLVQMALPMALTYAAGPIGAKLGGMGLFKGMSPLMANALKQSALGFGTGVLSGSKRPWKSAMYAGLTSIPFSYMSAANAANTFNQQYADVPGWEKYAKTPGIPARMENIQAAGMPPMQRYIPKVDPTWGFERMAKGPGSVSPKVSAWDVLTGGKANYSEGVPIPDTLRTESYKFADDAIKSRNPLFGEPGEKEFLYKAIRPGFDQPLPDASIFSKTTPLQEVYDPKSGTYLTTGGESKADWLPTMASQAAALYGGMPTEEEEWEAAKKKRIKELAFMYGVPEDMIEGEFDNPWNTGAFMNSGGIASLNMDLGGDVSGPGGPKDDMIDAKLSDGEFVMTAKAVENLGNGDRYEGARKMYSMMNMLDPESETMQEVV